MVRMTRFLVAAASIPGLVLCTASCSPRNTKTSYAGADIGQPAAVAYGRIVSMRPVLMQAGNTEATGSAAGFADGSDVRGNILGAIGGAPAGISKGKPANHGAPVEFIVRRDDGQIISVVQTNDARFQPGDRALLTQGAQTRLARAGA